MGKDDNGSVAFGGRNSKNIRIIDCEVDGVFSVAKYENCGDVSIFGGLATNVSGHAVEINSCDDFNLDGLVARAHGYSTSVPLSKLGNYLQMAARGRVNIKASTDPSLDNDRESNMSEKFTAFKVTNSKIGNVENFYADGFSAGILIEDSTAGDFKNIVLLGPGGVRIDDSISRSFAESMKRSGRVDQETVNNAAQESGLISYIKEHGIEVAAYLTELADKAAQIDWSNIL